MAPNLIDVSGLPDAVVGQLRQLVVLLQAQHQGNVESNQPKTGVLDFLDSLPPSSRSAVDWEQFEREFQVERDRWDR
jgi:hypothetical protein